MFQFALIQLSSTIHSASWRGSWYRHGRHERQSSTSSMNATYPTAASSRTLEIVELGSSTLLWSTWWGIMMCCFLTRLVILINHNLALYTILYVALFIQHGLRVPILNRRTPWPATCYNNGLRAYGSLILWSAMIWLAIWMYLLCWWCVAFCCLLFLLICLVKYGLWWGIAVTAAVLLPR